MKTSLISLLFLLYKLSDACELGGAPVTIKAYGNVDDYKASLVEIRPQNFNSDLSSFSKIIFLYGQMLELCEGMFNLDNLEVLQMNHMGVSYIEPGTFGQLPKLRTINLKANNITKIDDGIFNGLPIHYLLLTSNKIKYIHPDAFDNLVNLEIISLEDNKIQHIDTAWFKFGKNIRYLSLENNMISAIPKRAFIQLNSSKEHPMKLYLNWNRIDRIDAKAFENIQYFDTLDLSHNRLTTIPNIFQNAVQVKHLSLSYNNLVLTGKDVSTFIVVDNLNLMGYNSEDCFFVHGYLGLDNKNLTSRAKCTYIPNN